MNNYEYLKGKSRKEEFKYLKYNSNGDESYYNHNRVRDSHGNELLEVCEEEYNSYEYYDIFGNNIAYADGDYPIEIY